MSQEPIEFTNRTARLGLPYLFAGQAQKEFIVNESLALLDSLVHPAVEGEAQNPPATPSEGETWLVGDQAGGDWAGHETSIANWQNGAWLLIAPHDGMRLFDKATGQHIFYAEGWRRGDSPQLPGPGQTEDSELRAAFANLIEELRNAGIFAVI